MDYEKKYKEALEIAGKILKRGYYISGDIEAIFPELKESEDEEIRKAIIKGLSSCGTKYWGGFEVAKALAWLKKQKPKMNPKWLYRLEYKDNSCGLWYDGNGKWCFEKGIGSLDDSCTTKSLPMNYDKRYKQGGRDWFSSCSNKEDLLHWYSKRDARTLLNNGFVFTRYLATEYHEYENETVFIKNTALFREEINFFDLMKQEWTEDDEKIINTIINEFEQCSFRCCSNGLRKEDCIAWLNKIKHIEWFEWNDKDKEKLNSLCIYLDQMLSFNMVNNKDVTELKTWLKSLKDRVQPRPKQGWSEKDEKGLGGALWCCKQAASIAKDENDMDNCWYAENWLKSLKPRSHCVVTKDELNMAKKDAYNNALDKIEYSSGEPTFDDGWNAALSFVRKRVAGIEGDEDIIIREKEPDDAYLKGVCDTKYKLEKQGEKNPAWSDEDEKMRLDAIKYLEIFDAQGIHGNKAVPCINWLKSLKERVQPQPKQEWSKEDDEMLGVAMRETFGKGYLSVSEWLKSLKERVGNFDDGYKVEFSAAKHNQWKPSDEQIKILSIYADQNNYHGTVLTSLYQDLKKLKG